MGDGQFVLVKTFAYTKNLIFKLYRRGVTFYFNVENVAEIIGLDYAGAEKISKMADAVVVACNAVYRTLQGDFAELPFLVKVLEALSEDPSLELNEVAKICSLKQWLTSDTSSLKAYLKDFCHPIAPKKEKTADVEERPPALYLPYIKPDNKFTIARCKLRDAISALDAAEEQFDYWQDADALTEQGKKAWNVTLKARDYVLKLFYDQIVYTAKEIVDADLKSKGFILKCERIKE